MSKKMNDEGMRLIADLLKTVMPKGHGFTLFVFEENKKLGKFHYISTAQRDSMIEIIESWMEKQKHLSKINKDIDTNLN